MYLLAISAPWARERGRGFPRLTNGSRSGAANSLGSKIAKNLYGAITCRRCWGTHVE